MIVGELRKCTGTGMIGELRKCTGMIGELRKCIGMIVVKLRKCTGTGMKPSVAVNTLFCKDITSFKSMSSPSLTSSLVLS